MKNLFSLVFAVMMCLLLYSQLVSAERRALTKTISAEIPDDYIYEKTGDKTAVYYSPDKQTFFSYSVYSVDELPSKWDNVRKYDERVYRYDTLSCLSDKHAYFWQLSKAYCTRQYDFPGAKIFYSDTRIINVDRVLNTRFYDGTGERGEVFDQYLSSVTSTETFIGKLYRITMRNKWFWIVLAILVSFIGAVNHTEEKKAHEYLSVSGIVTAAVGVLLCLLMPGEWAAIGCYMLLAFLLVFLTGYFGFYLTLDD